MLYPKAHSQEKELRRLHLLTKVKDLGERQKLTHSLVNETVFFPIDQ